MTETTHPPDDEQERRTRRASARSWTEHGNRLEKLRSVLRASALSTASKASAKSTKSTNIADTRSTPATDAPRGIDGKIACITLDLENNWDLDERYDYRTFEYIEEYAALMSDLDVPVSVFVVGRTLEERPGAVRTLAEGLPDGSEFHLHSYSHDLTGGADTREEVRLGSAAFADFFGHEPIGYRAPRGMCTEEDMRILAEEGFEFDASIFPSYRPGVYNNLTSPTVPYRPGPDIDLVEIPFAVHPLLRIPIAQSYLKLFGSPYLKLLEHGPLPNLLVFDSHLQDFYYTEAHKQIDQPRRFIYKRNRHRSVRMFRTFVERLRERGYEFATVNDVYESVV